MLGEERQAHPRRHAQVFVADAVGRAKPAGEVVLRHARRGAVALQGREREGEQHAVQARRDAAARIGGKAPGDLPEQLVARWAAERVVDGLEAVDVDQRHGGAAAALARRREELREPLAEQRAVRQPGERIVVGVPLDRLAQLRRVPAALAQRRREHQTGGHHHADEGEQHEEQLVQRHRREELGPLEHVPDGDRAHRGDRAGHLALAEAERGPDDERQGNEAERERREARGVVGGDREHRRREEHGEGRCFQLLLQRPGLLAARAPGKHERRDDDHPGGVALPPGPPAAQAFLPRQHMCPGERQRRERGGDDRAQAAHQHAPRALPACCRSR